MYETYDEKIQRATSHLIPIYTHLELTYRCNERCVHCYALVNKAQQKELTTDEYRRLLDQLAELGTLYLAMTGGEIFCRDDFFDIAHYARKKSFALRLFTNGLSVTPEIVEQLVDLNPLRIEVSLYAVNSDIHDGITGLSESHQRTMKTINMMLTAGLNLTIKTPVMQKNISEVHLVKQFALSRGMEFISNPTIVPRGNGGTDNLAYRLDNQQMNYYFDKVNNEWFFKQPKQESTLCGAGKGIMSISPYGEVFPCVQMPIKLGNIRAQSLKEIWFHSTQLKQIRELTLSKIKQCSRCEDIKYCNPCSGLALVEDGDLLKPSSEACRQARIRKSVLTKKRGWQPDPNTLESDCLI